MSLHSAISFHGAIHVVQDTIDPADHADYKKTDRKHRQDQGPEHVSMRNALPFPDISARQAHTHDRSDVQNEVAGPQTVGCDVWIRRQVRVFNPVNRLAQTLHGRREYEDNTKDATGPCPRYPVAVVKVKLFFEDSVQLPRYDGEANGEEDALHKAELYQALSKRAWPLQMGCRRPKEAWSE